MVKNLNFQGRNKLVTSITTANNYVRIAMYNLSCKYTLDIRPSAQYQAHNICGTNMNTLKSITLQLYAMTRCLF